jgi:hypothetical protein
MNTLMNANLTGFIYSYDMSIEYYSDFFASLCLQ